MLDLFLADDAAAPAGGGALRPVARRDHCRASGRRRPSPDQPRARRRTVASPARRSPPSTAGSSPRASSPAVPATARSSPTRSRSRRYAAPPQRSSGDLGDRRTVPPPPGGWRRRPAHRTARPARCSRSSPGGAASSPPCRPRRRGTANRPGSRRCAARSPAGSAAHAAWSRRPDEVIVTAGAQGAFDLSPAPCSAGRRRRGRAPRLSANARRALAPRGPALAPSRSTTRASSSTASPTGAGGLRDAVAPGADRCGDVVGRRRLALLDLARRRGVRVIEDDYDTEYRYVDRPLEPLQRLDPRPRRLRRQLLQDDHPVAAHRLRRRPALAGRAARHDSCRRRHAPAVPHPGGARRVHHLGRAGTAPPAHPPDLSPAARPSRRPARQPVLRRRARRLSPPLDEDRPGAARGGRRAGAGRRDARRQPTPLLHTVRRRAAPRRSRIVGAVPLEAVLRHPFERRIVDVDEAEPLGVALRPLEVVEQRPDEVPTDVDAVRERRSPRRDTRRGTRCARRRESVRRVCARRRRRRRSR